MYKQSGLLVIAALVISAMGVLAPATTVAAALPTVTLEPTIVQDNGYVLFTLTVTNPSGSGENVENIIIKDISTGTTGNFGGSAIFGENVAENIDNVVDNLHEAEDLLKEVSENLRNARTRLTDAGNALIEAASYLDSGGLDLQTSGRENVNTAGDSLRQAAVDLDKAGDALKEDPVNLSNVRENLKNAATDIRAAGAALDEQENNLGDYLVLTAGTENLDNAAECLSHVAENLEGTNFWGAAGADNIMTATGEFFNAEPLTADNGLATVAIFFANFADNILENYTGTGEGIITGSAADKMDNVAEELINAAENLRQVSENIWAAGTALSHAENYLENAENIWVMSGRKLTVDLADSARTGLITLLDDNFHENLQDAALAMSADREAVPCSEAITGSENLLKAGSFIENSINFQNIWLGTTLASSIIGVDGTSGTNSYRYWLGIVGASLVDNDNIGLTEAANALDNAATRLSDAATIISTTMGDLTPTTGWGVQADEGGLRFRSFGEEPGESHDNAIKPGGSKTFKFLWNAPDLNTLENHTIRVWLYDNDNNAITTSDFTVTVDGAHANLDMRVYQTGVVDYQGNAVDNVVGKRLNDNKAVLEIVASKALSTMNTIKFENWKIGGENLELSFSDLTTTDDLTFTYEFDVSDWTDNAENARVYIAGPSSTTSTGVENENSAELFFFVDLLDPVFASLVGTYTAENGLRQFEDLVVIQKPGTDNVYLVHTELTGWTIKGRAEDNENVGEEGWEPGGTVGDADNDLWAITTVYVNDVAQTMSRLPDDNYNASVTLQEGVNTIRVEVKDRVGNIVENKIENVFIDNTKPIVEFVTVGDVSWTDNGITIGDNKPTFRLKIYDSGFTGCTGIGIPRDNLDVTLAPNANFEDNDNEIDNNMDNSWEWDNGAGTDTYNFENMYDNDNKGLADGTWYLRITVSDNLHDNENHVRSFIIDTTKPSAPASVTGSVTAGASASARTVITSTSISLSGTAEADGTIKVEISTDNGVTWTEQTAASATVDSDGNWTTSVTVTEGTITGIRVSVTDTASNESTTTLFGYVLADSASPTVTITSPADGTATDAVSITVLGTITKDAWESWDDLTVTIQVGTESVTIPISAGAFTYSVALAEGVNTVLVSVTDGTNTSGTSSVSVTRTVTPWATYAIIVVIVALILAAIAIFRKR